MKTIITKAVQYVTPPQFVLLKGFQGSEGAKLLPLHHYGCIDGGHAMSCHCGCLMCCRASGTRNDVKSKAAFTLAEVLITLGIIGIVAALTIPTLVQKFQEKAWNTSATVFERKLEEALKVMNTRETLAGYNNTKDFVNELSNHFKITKICDTVTDCFEDTVYWDVLDISAGTTVSDTVSVSNITTASDLGQSDWKTETIGVQFANGTSGVIAYNPDCKQDPFSNQITGTSCLALLYDTTGHSKPNTYGKDLRAINASLGCAFKSGSTCYGTPFTPTYLTKAECEEVKDSLGISACYWDKDYWAGAVQQCGGVNNMPTMAQLAEIANYVYNTSGIGAYGDDLGGARLDRDKVASLGFTLDSSTVSFTVWSNEETSSREASYRYFSSGFMAWDNLRIMSDGQAVCLN